MLRNDYSTVAPEILEALAAATSPSVGYGEDAYCALAEERIKRAFSAPDGKVVFLSGGTQANMCVVSYLLRPWQSAVCVVGGHINGHESAAVEGTGHKIVTVPGRNGKITPDEITAVARENAGVHTAKPGLVYISDATECGSVYSRAELSAIRKVCDEYGLYLFIDGARLATALTSEGTDVDAAYLAKICDVFYVGGTKNGLLFGEAVVFRDAALAEDFRRFSKNRGAMSAKGFVLGIQFARMFDEDDLYFSFGRRANRTAKIIREKLIAAGVPVSQDAPTNQIFLTLPRSATQILTNEYGCQVWEDPGADRLMIRAVTAFDTTEGEANAFADRVVQLFCE